MDVKVIDPEISAPDDERVSDESDANTASVPLRLLSIDIETDRWGSIRCISMIQQLAHDGRLNTIGQGQQTEPEGFYRELLISLQRDGVQTAFPIQWADDEASLLRIFRETILSWDPDIITGWNAIAFDLERIVDRMRALGVIADFGRSTEAAQYLPGNKEQADHCDIPGRVAIDAMRLFRMQGGHFESYSLDAVASEVLGRGKSEQFESGRKMDELDAMWNNEPRRFLEYCRQDSLLVLELLAKSGLMELTIRRSQLCGTSIGRAWASVHAFEQLYIRRLHRLGLAAPDHGVDALPMTESPGGTIIQPQSGNFEYVLLFDFKGLYPSIIRSFGIDPLAHQRCLRLNQAIDQGQTTSPTVAAPVMAPNNAPFDRQAGILPQLLTEFYRLREAAKARKDATASYVYKILANSFYGVLGSPGCRFAGSDLATAITSFAREILYWSRDFAAARGYQAIYGDTDSLFLLPPAEQNDFPENAADTRAQLFYQGAQLAGELNTALGAWVQQRWGCQSHLELEFEQMFKPLYIPPLKSVASSEIARNLRSAGLEGPLGRAKSYAGLGYSNSNARAELIIKGMEAIRSDWTPFARKAQRRLLMALLEGRDREMIQEELRHIISGLNDPKQRADLVISKRLSRPASAYAGNPPVHVRAALLAQQADKKRKDLRRIKYIMGSGGPIPTLTREELTAALPNPTWYVEKQLLPIITSINAAADFDLEAMCRSFVPEHGQGELW